MTKASKKKMDPQTAVSSINVGIAGKEGVFGDQTGVAFKLLESGIIYYDSYVDGQKYQTGEIA
uniref:Uncharacterized protein n=1 Tax=Polynucleobacter necessarius subsp. necessarius (strain STIR1) TaxID=452638 RepID=B1XUQ9_POLNS